MLEQNALPLRSPPRTRAKKGGHTSHKVRKRNGPLYPGSTAVGIVIDTRLEGMLSLGA